MRLDFTTFIFGLTDLAPHRDCQIKPCYFAHHSHLGTLFFQAHKHLFKTRKFLAKPFLLHGKSLRDVGIDFFL